MTEIPATPPQGVPTAADDPRRTAFIIYILYLAHFVPVVGWIAGLVGLVMAYVERPTAPDWLVSHYRLLIRTFWIGLLYYFVSILLCLVLIGWMLLVATFVWFVVRCALGLSRLMRNEAYPTPESWLV
jgi:uncharacterized membrane protein